MSNRKILINSYACFFVHFCIEIICFSILSHTFGLNTVTKFFVYMFFDMVAFYPQFLVGIVHERFPKLNIPVISVGIMAVGLLIVQYDEPSVRSIVGMMLIALGNAFLHDCCAIQTTLIGKGKLFPCALFVAGGSFGVVLGQTLASVPFWNKWHLFIVLFVMLLLLLYTNSSWLIEKYEYPVFDMVKTDKKHYFAIVMFTAYFVTFVRSFIAYAIPISWKKETWQAFLLFFTMGVGKALGGWLSDKIGARKVGIYTTLISVPFLIWGQNHMVVSITGIFFFSMTMAITFGMFLSVLPRNPGVAFGLTTLALGNGIMIPFVTGPVDPMINAVLIVVLSIICSLLLAGTLKEEKKNVKHDTI